MKHIKLPETGHKSINVIDPCMGEGLALKQIAETLGIPESQVYGIELDKLRSSIARENLPCARILGPCSDASSWVTPGSFGLAYVNPPFDTELGGGRREEYSFAKRAWARLSVGGILVLVTPFNAIIGKSSFCEFLDSAFEDARIWALPDGDDEDGNKIRAYKEVVYIGKKRPKQLGDDLVRQLGMFSTTGLKWGGYGTEDLMSRVGDPFYWTLKDSKRHSKEECPQYELAKAWKPHKFDKVGYLDEELYERLSRSPLNKLVKEYTTPPVARPPLPPGKGHVALLLASGMLDGCVHGEDGTHVVRGTAKKVDYFNEAATPEPTEDENGAVTSKEVWSQRVVLVLRAVWGDGEIHTYSDEPADEKEEAKEDRDSIGLAEAKRIQKSLPYDQEGD